MLHQSLLFPTVKKKLQLNIQKPHNSSGICSNKWILGQQLYKHSQLNIQQLNSGLSGASQGL